MRCQNKLDKLDYAVKIAKHKIRSNIFHLNLLDSSDRDKYLQELYALSALSVGFENPYIVRYYTGWIEDSRIHFVMELCKKSLRSYAQNIKKSSLIGFLTEIKIKQIMRDICLGLQELHGKGIVHLDIKPENIMEGFSGKFKIADLGLARIQNTI